MSSFPKQTQSILARTSAAMPLGQRVMSSDPGAPKYLDPGEHDVRVVGVDRNQLGDNKLTITYADASGKEYNDRLYWCETDRKTGEVDISRRIYNTLAGLIPNREAIDAFFAEVAADNAEVLDYLKGMKVRVSLRHGKGYAVSSVQGPDGRYYYQAVDTTTGALVAQSEQASDCKAQAEATGLKRAFTNAAKYIATHGDDNVAAFGKSLAQAHQPKATASTFFAPPRNPVGNVKIPF